MYYIILLAILAFLLAFITFFVKIYRDIQKRNSTTKSSYGLLITILVSFAWIIISLIYFDLSLNKKISFVDYYKFPINGQKSITIGSGDDDGRDTYLTNKLAVPNHLLLRLNNGNSDSIGTLELLTDKRKAIVNGTLLQNVSPTENSIREQLELTSKKSSKYINKIEVKDGDFIRIGYSNYKIYREKDNIILNNVSLNPLSPVNMFYLYTTTTYPDIVIGDRKGIEKISIIWLWGVTSFIFLSFAGILFFIVTKLTNYAKGEKHWAIIHPILYFTILLAFLFLASYINFTIMYFYQFNVYAKGSLFTEIVVYCMVLIFSLVAYLLYNFKYVFKASIRASIIYFVILLIFTIFFKEYIYSSTHILSIPKSIGIFLGEQLFIFAIFILFANFLKNGSEYLFIDSSKEYINNNIYKHFIYASIGLLGTIFILSLIGLIKEGQGMVFIETTKLFIFLLVTLLFHHSFGRNRNKYIYMGFISLFFILLIGTIFMVKDKGSILQVALALGIIFVLFKDNFRIKKRYLIAVAILIAALMVGFYHMELKDNVRYAMWTNPFAQEIEPSTQYFLYRYEQVARGLFLIKNSSFFSSDFVNNSFLPLPAIHTDFIFAFFSNIFGHIGVLSLLLALMLLSLSFKKSMTLYSQENEVFKFIYGINSVFIAYMLSYFIINMASVLQIIPLTDVPLPFLTYSKGILVLFLMLYIFVVLFNFNYIKHIKGK